MKFLGVDQNMKHTKMVTKAAESRLIKFLFLAMQWNKTLNEIIGTEVFLELIVLLDINQLRRWKFIYCL